MGRRVATDRKLVLALVATVPGRVRGDIEAGTRARDEVESLIESDFFEGVPFSQVSLVVHYGNRVSLTPEYEPIGRTDGFLRISVDLEMSTVKKARGEELREILRQALIEALIAVAQKYNRPCGPLLAASRPDLIPRSGPGSAPGSGQAESE